MSNIKFEIVDTTSDPYATRKGGKCGKFLRECLELAKENEGKTLLIHLNHSLPELGGKTVKSLQSLIGNWNRHDSRVAYRVPLGDQGFLVTFRNAKTDDPIMYVTYNKPITESEG